MSPAMVVMIAAAVVAFFAFLSISTWTAAQSRERRDRDRYALLKAVAEQPGDNAQRVLEALRDQERQEAVRKQQEERRGYLVGGLVLLAVGTGLSVMLAAVSEEPHMWTVGLIMLLIGLVLTAVGMAMRPPRDGQ
ncbi:MAG TPA: DUF6249 domain-containing protein [Vicinamibacteria bacterium]|nr:DUF6249 domain-containing protein [Vicinamibacteria bacterium]